ncbi:hypothetical protein [Novosphingobium profundi]|uniref:hypothetical protein n=1 Tax=Novosphingobium profundi TaxID=1774954 RepID=UPI001CFCEA58|nr:hypothetical protein [Novosphingobium profundi]
MRGKIRHKALALATGTALALGLPSGAGASGDFGCAPSWRLGLSDYECAGVPFLSARNDTRTNLSWLMMEAGGGIPKKAGYPANSWETAPLGHVFLTWEAMRSGFWPGAQAEEETWPLPAYSGTLCQTLASGGEAFAAALADTPSISEAERGALVGARANLKAACDGAQEPSTWPASVTSPAGREYLAYLKGARAFYAEDFGSARATFAGLEGSGQGWVAETARYMQARTALAAAQVPAIDEWGWYDNTKTDAALAAQGQAALEAYLRTYPEGRYAASARGLTRRAFWLRGQRPELSRAYGALLERESAADPAAAHLIEEIDTKLFFEAAGDGEIDSALSLATWDLLRLRASEPVMSERRTARLDAAELAAQAPHFAGHPKLYTYLQAAQAFHVQRDYAAVLKLLPDEARKGQYTPLAFSAQMLRGLALEALGDSNAVGFWEQLAKGADPRFQRPAVELALAHHWERSGELAKVFAANSPVQVPEIRAILLEHVADGATLRAQAKAGTSGLEREVAAMTLLYKDLTRGHFADFERDRALVPQSAGREGWIGGWLRDAARQVPLGSFTKGRWQQDFACPALADTAQRLARDGSDPGALLCLADFYRLNNFDSYMAGERWRGREELGGTPSRFAGELTDRAAIYAQVLAGSRASAQERAYALYRSVMCYAPSGNNSCSATDVPESQRKAWFQRLKREYPKSRWATKLKFYW